MGRRKNRISAGQRSGEEEVLAYLNLLRVDNDDLADEKDNEDNMFEKLRKRDGLFFEVLSRLNPPSLFRLRCVSKGLSNYIAPPDFAAHHYRTCKTMAGKGLTGLFFQDNRGLEIPWWYPERIWFMPVVPEAGGLPDPPLKFLKRGIFDEVDIIDSCNGLLFCINKAVSMKNAYFVCNPLTKEKVVLPHPKKPSLRVAYALMADLDGNYLKYKVLCLVPVETLWRRVFPVVNVVFRDSRERMGGDM